MKVFIFGAGASKGAQHNTVDGEAIAPLTNDLFDPRYSKFADMVGLSKTQMNKCRNAIEEHKYFEEWLTKEWESVKKYKLEQTRNAKKGFLGRIALYIWLILCSVSKWTHDNKNQNRETNSYEELMNKILEIDEAFGLLSFNYDLILDYAIKDVFNVTFHSLEDYLNINYVKLHGSINWLLNKRESDPEIELENEYHMDTKVRLDTISNLIYQDNPIPLEGLLVKDPDHRDLDSIDDLLRSFKQQYFYPLIFLPLTSKAYSSIEGFEEQILKKGKELLSASDEIYLIGYSAGDSLIRDMLMGITSLKKIHIVGNSTESSKEIMERVLSWNPSKLEQGEIFPTGFHDFAYSVKL